MDLHNTLPHMRGKSIMVNGTKYALDAHGVARDVAAEDADKLLRRANGAWRVYAERHPVHSGDGSAPSQGEDATVPNMDTSAVLAAQDQFEAQKRGEANPRPSEQVEGAAGGAAEEMPESQDGVQPVEGEDSESGEALPDPGMDIEDLRQMADAYEVPHNARTSKDTLVERIMEAMKR